MSAAADKPSEYLKRTCLICGCNTNQTINIYEPRSGPNIVELIQAKFKFQPLNEDKYLCFSCNNWLINWHSLQANNSNDAESPSGTFRAAQVNGGLAQDKRAANLAAEQKQQQQKQSTTTAATLCRPIAQVRPQQILMAVEAEEATKNRQLETINTATTTISKKYAKHFYAKRNSAIHWRKIGVKKHLSACYVCGRTLVLCLRRNSAGASSRISHKLNTKCRKCRNVCKWRSIYMRSLKFYKPPKHTNSGSTTSQCLLVNSNKNLQPTQQFKRPTVDGKIVAMLRRLGTTLSRECQTTTAEHAQQLPPIMSPAKPKPRWLRPLESDEILLNFETAISEVLPLAKQVEHAAAKATNAAALKTARRKLTYQISTSEAQSKEINQSSIIVADYQGLLNSLPSGLNVSMI